MVCPGVHIPVLGPALPRAPPAMMARASSRAMEGHP